MMKKLCAILLAAILLTGCLGAYAEGDNVFHVYSDRVFRTFNQVTGSDSHLFEILGAISECLLRLDENHNPQPALAESFTVSDDGLVYTFTLRDGLVWSNGTPLTAKDFEFSWLEAISDSENNGYADVIAPFLKNGVAFMNGEIDAAEVGVKALDDKTFEVTLANPCAFFDRFLTLPVLAPLNEEFYKAQGDLYATSADTILCCGPFVATSMDLSVGVTMVKNDKYWDAANVKLDGIGRASWTA